MEAFIFLLVVAIFLTWRYEKRRSKELDFVQKASLLIDAFEELDTLLLTWLKQGKTLQECTQLFQSRVTYMDEMNASKFVTGTLINKCCLAEIEGNIVRVNQHFFRKQGNLLFDDINNFDLTKTVAYSAHFLHINKEGKANGDCIVVVSREYLYIVPQTTLDQIRSFSQTKLGENLWEAIISLTDLDIPGLDKAIILYRNIDQFNVHFSASLKNNIISKLQKTKLCVIPLKQIYGIYITPIILGDISRIKTKLFDGHRMERISIHYKTRKGRDRKIDIVGLADFQLTEKSS